MALSRVPAGQGLEWVKSGTNLVMDRPLIWIGGMAATFGFGFALKLLPFIGGILGQVFHFVMGLFFLCYAHAQVRNQDFDLDNYTAQGKGALGRLILLWLLTIGLTLLCMAPMIGTAVAVGGLEWIQNQTHAPHPSLASIIAIAIGTLLTCVCAFFLLAATSFATPLVLFQNYDVLPSMRASLQAVSRNVMPFLINGLVLLVLLLICVIPFGLGLLFWFPLLTTSYYLAYEEILGKPDPL